MSTIFKVLIFILIFTTNVLANCIEGDCEDGQGTMILNDKKYVGGFKDGKRHGQGTSTYIKGEFKGVSYIGIFKNDKPHGQGTVTYASGDKYVGEFKDGKYHGQGTATYANGAKYVGEFKDWKYHGQGTATYASGGKYVGEFKDGKANGQGIYTYANGAKYVGEFKDGNFHGQGTFTYADGNKYAGEFKDSKRNGQGTLIFPDEKKYVGEFKNDKYHGQGTYTWPSGKKYVGEFKNDKMHGKGILTSPDGKKYAGEFKDNKFNKQGTLTSSKAKTKKIGNGISINIPDGYKYESITLDKLLSRFKSEVKNLSKDDLKSAEEIGIGKLSKLIFITKNKKNIDFFNKITTSSGYEKISKNFTGGMDEVYNSPNFGKLVFEAVEKNNPNIDLSKISDEEWAKFVDEIFNDKDFDKKYKELSKLLEESARLPLTNILSEYPIDEPKIVIFLGDIQIKDEVFDEINNLNPDSAYEQLIKFLKTIPGSEILKPDELKIQIQKNKFGNLYMINNNKNVNTDTIFTKPQYSEFVLTTHKNKLFLAFSSCWNKCNNSSTGTDLGLVDILGHTNLFQSIKLSTVDIRY